MAHDELNRLANLERVYAAAKLHVQPFAAAHLAGIEYLYGLWFEA